MQTIITSNVRKQWLTPGNTGSVWVFLVGILLLGCGCRQNHDSAGRIAAANDGLPRTLAALNAWYVEPPSGQNAATFYSQGFDALQIGNVETSSLPLLGKGTLPPPGSPLPMAMKPALAAFVHSNQKPLQLLTAGANYETCRYPLDLARGVDAIFPHLPKVRTAAKVTQLSAILHAEAGDGKQAATDVLTSLGLARSLEAEPSMISQSMRAAVVSNSIPVLERVMNRSVLSQEPLGALSTAFHKMEDYDARGEGFDRAMAGERVNLIALLGTPQKLLELLPALGADLAADQRDQIMARLQAGKKLNPEQEYFEETFRQILAVRKAAFPERLRAADLIRQRVTKASQEKLAIAAWLLPGLAAHLNREAGCLASLRLGLAAIALEEFRAAGANRYPDSLAELIPKYLSSPPVDPFDGQALRYRKKGAGYLLYSVGPDLKDDSGEGNKNADIVFEVVGSARSGT